jgi:acyl dehydratase
MTATKVDGLAGVRGVPIGQSLGSSEWVTITQDIIDGFAEATGDHQWIHVDSERAKSGPFGTTIAHGYLTLSLIPCLLPDIVDFTGFKLTVNYGCEKVRFPAPVPVNQRVRASAAITQITELENGVQLAVEITIEIENSVKPACVATILIRQYS